MELISNQKTIFSTHLENIVGSNKSKYVFQLTIGITKNVSIDFCSYRKSNSEGLNNCYKNKIDNAGNFKIFNDGDKHIVILQKKFVATTIK
ncbi:hypothetical protein HGG64_03140 [Mycoplasma phocoeninasale]|uniref:Uncharacterized protein n=1 Tax=Mycoplasma phocoeninasale TaxID=2726117 RepID=A0A858U3T7_9MOLU|nr:hypothetical protein [Mycoplasma phocoeninasale]QJG66671.1 hypothetical protein HGG64_03140 [Mycoplasma phocoeninasale]